MRRPTGPLDDREHDQAEDGIADYGALMLYEQDAGIARRFREEAVLTNPAGEARRMLDRHLRRRRGQARRAGS